MPAGRMPANDGELQFTLPDALKLSFISHHGNVNAIIGNMVAQSGWGKR